MKKAARDVTDLLAQVRAGSREALGQLFETYRRYLLLVAERELDSDLRAKGGASDLVQETFLEAQRDFARFRGTTEGEFLAWLRQLLLNNLGHFTRRYRATAKRDVAREISLDAGSSAPDLAEALVSDQAPPCTTAIAQEQREQVRRALDRLPDDYRQVILWRYEEDLAFEVI